MKICTKEVEKKKDCNDPPKIGHIYKASQDVSGGFGNLAFMVEDWSNKKLILISLATGEMWSTDSPFGESSALYWHDVTDSYCIKEL